MTQDDIIRMAEEAGCKWAYGTQPLLVGEEMLERFAALVAAAEREDCAKLCDDKVDSEYSTGKVDHNEMSWSMACAIAIRARGEKP